MKPNFISLFLVLLVPALVACSGERLSGIEPQSPEELAGLRVATVAGSSYEMELSSRKDIKLDLYNSDSDLLQALLNEKVDVVVHDEVVYNAVVRKEHGVKICHVEDTTFPTAFLFRDDETELAQVMTDIQHRMIADGSMQKLKDFWLTDRYALAGEYTHIPDETSGKPLRVASSTDSAPLAFMIDGEWYGLEIDLLRELGKELHRPLEIKRYDSGSTLLAVSSGLADVL